MEYFGHYRSSTLAQTGCVKEFLTVVQGNMLFPPQISYYCDLCKKDHGFRFVGGRIASTPKQKERLALFAANNHIETDVTLP